MIIKVEITKTFDGNTKLKHPNKISRVIYDDREEWWKDGMQHREGDLPAITHKNGIKEWYKEGKLHREGDLPAIEWPNRTKKWYKNGKLHREGDLPAVINNFGAKFWYKEGNLHREGDLPAIEHVTGTKEWYKYGLLDRRGDLPAVEEMHGSKIWYKSGWCHRDDGLPAVEWISGRKEWWHHGTKITETLAKELYNRMIMYGKLQWARTFKDWEDLPEKISAFDQAVLDEFEDCQFTWNYKYLARLLPSLDAANGLWELMEMHAINV